MTIFGTIDFLENNEILDETILKVEHLNKLTQSFSIHSFHFQTFSSDSQIFTAFGCFKCNYLSCNTKKKLPTLSDSTCQSKSFFSFISLPTFMNELSSFFISRQNFFRRLFRLKKGVKTIIRHFWRCHWFLPICA